MGCSLAATKKSLSARPLAAQPPATHQLVNVHQAKTHLSQLLRQVELGQEVVIASLPAIPPGGTTPPSRSGARGHRHR
jgi:hypothetical protein